MKRILVVCTAALMAACVTPEEAARQRAQADRAQADLNSASAAATVSCSSKAACEKAFSLAKSYVHENADMKVQMSDDTTIFTYNPTQYGYVALRATRVRGAGDSSTIRLSATCKGQDPRDAFFTLCANRMEMIYRGFRPYVEARM